LPTRISTKGDAFGNNDTDLDRFRVFFEDGNSNSDNDLVDDLGFLLECCSSMVASDGDKLAPDLLRAGGCLDLLGSLFDNSDFVRVGLFGFKPALAFVVITKFSPDLLRLGCFIEPALAFVVITKFSPDLLRLGCFGLESLSLSLSLSFIRFTLEFLLLGGGCCFDFVVRVEVGRFVRHCCAQRIRCCT
jgi:hypothetical protein